MDIIVGIGDMKMSSEEDDQLITYGLGSCLGIAVYDPVVHVGGMVHCMLPSSRRSARTNMKNAFHFVDTGLTLLFKLAALAGAENKNLKLYVAGGASFKKDLDGIFAVGKKNLLALHEMVVKEGLEVSGMEIGGHIARTMRLHIRTGQVTVSTGGKVREL